MYEKHCDYLSFPKRGNRSAKETEKHKDKITQGKTCGLGLDDMSLAWPAVVQLLVFIYSGISRISHEYSSLFIIVINLIFMFSL